MLTAVKAPLTCFGLSYKKADPMCKACPHAADCRVYMGNRLSRIAVSDAKFSIVPQGFTATRHMEETNKTYRDIEAIYCECHFQVFGSHPTGYVGIYCEKLFQLAELCKVSVPLFVLISMFGHSEAYPTTAFSPSMLVDNHAAVRVNRYADACKQKFGAVNAKLLDMLTNGDLDVYNLSKRMLDSEIKAGRWIIDYKLYHQGPPFEPMFDDIENLLDPCWLATETRYEQRMKLYSTRSVQPKDILDQDTYHSALTVYARMKKFKYEAICNHQTRENILPKAVGQVLHAYGYTAHDFEIEDKPISDPLQFWNRLAIAIQHLECLLFVNYQEGIYASA
jgi:hypothetical protein